MTSRQKKKDRNKTSRQTKDPSDPAKTQTAPRQPTNRDDSGIVMPRKIQAYEEWSGALPSPRSIKEYEQILPGAAERIFSNFEKQTEHRIRSETTVIQSRTQISKLGMIFGFILALIIIALACYCIYKEQDELALQLIGVITTAITLIGIASKIVQYLEVSQKQKKDRD